MTVNVGDRFKWNRKGSILQVTEIKGCKVRFEVTGNLTLTGCMHIQEFRDQFLTKSKVAA